MSIKTVLLALIAGDGERPRAAVDYAVALAAEHRAHLSVVIGAIRVPVVVYSGVAEVQALVLEENDQRSSNARAIGDDVAAAAALHGVPVTTDVVTEAIDPLFRRIATRARLHDLSICARPRATDIWTSELAETLLLSSGRPVIAVPDGFDPARAGRHVLVAWDGTAVAARAVGEAVPLLERAGLVEIITVSGDKHADDLVPGADLAPMLAHHGMRVQVTELPWQRDVCKAMLAHATHVHAGLIVMGGYAHSRLRQMVLGGTTRSMLQTATVPVFMAH